MSHNVQINVRELVELTKLACLKNNFVFYTEILSVAFLDT